MRKTTLMNAMTVITMLDARRLGALVSSPPGGGGRPRGFDMTAEVDSRNITYGGGKRFVLFMLVVRDVAY